MIEVIIYSKKNCVRCTYLKAYLTENNIPYTEKNLVDLETITFLTLRNIFPMGAPCMEVDGKFYYSYTLFEDNQLVINMLRRIFNDKTN